MNTPPIGRLHDADGPVEIQARRIGEPGPPVLMDEASAFVDFWRGVITARPWYDPDKETLVVFSLDTRLQLKAWHLVSIGTMTEASFGIVESFRPAVLVGAYAVVMAHNHTSGDPRHSRQDLLATRALIAAGDTLNIPALDHVIIGQPGWISLRGVLEGSAESPWNVVPFSREA